MRTTPNSPARLVVTFFALFVVVVGVGRPVGAHTDFDFSLPTDGASVGEPVSEVTVAFTLPVTLVGNGFEVLDPQGNLQMPFAVTDDGTVFRLQFDPPLAGGAVGVKYAVTAGDGHVLSGAFSFTVSVDAPAATTTVPPTTTVVPTDVPATEPPAVVPTPDAAAAGEPVARTADDFGTDGSDDSSSSTIVAAVIVAALAAAFLVVRSRGAAGEPT